jgi:hypothetical protein
MRILLAGSILASILNLLSDLYWPLMIPVTLMLMRLNVGGLLNYQYYSSSKLFPVLVKGAVFAVSNSVARPFQAMATITAEYISNPAYLIIGFCCLTLLITTLIKETDIDDFGQLSPSSQQRKAESK